MPPQQKGFTIIELLISVSVFAFLVISVAMLFTNVFSGSKQGLLAVDNIDQARFFSSRFINEIRNATTGVDGAYSLNTAEPTQIIFYSTIANGGSTIYRIRYYLSGTTLYKGTVAPSGNPLSYNLAQEVIKPVQNDASSGATPVIFTYYNDSYDGSTTPLPQPVNVTMVKFVKIDLNILKQTNQGASDVFSISEGAAIRNLKTNLGN